MPRTEEQVKNVVIPELGMTLEQALTNIKDLTAQVTAIRGALKFSTVTYTKEQRQKLASKASFRGGEKEALENVFGAIEAFPGTAETLAEQDEGTDSSRFEDELVYARMLFTTNLETLTDEVQSLADDLGDTAISIGLRCKPLLLAAYQMYKTASAKNQKILSLISKTIDFYRDMVRPNKK